MAIWKQKDGTEILVEDMTENHLMNSILLIERRIIWNNRTLTMLQEERKRRDKKRAALDKAKMAKKPTKRKGRYTYDDRGVAEW